MKESTPTQIITKLDHAGREVFSWHADLLESTPTSRLVRAMFTLTSVPVDKILLNPGDVFIESYFSDRWYNVFEIHDQNTDQIKAWYVNLSYPASFFPGAITWRDLALDLLVYPDGSNKVLDVDEFEALEIDIATRKQCLKVIEQLRAQINTQASPVFSARGEPE